MFRQLSVRLFVLLMVLLSGMFSFYAFVNIRVQEQNLMQHIIDDAARASELIRHSTRYSMLLNRKQDVYQIIRTLGNTAGVDGIRIYNKTGEVIFSTDQEELGHRVDMSAEACNICHNESWQVTPVSGKSTRIFESPKGYRIMGLIDPIPNDPDCSSAECHAHPANQTVLGVLDVKMSLQKVDQELAANQRKTIYFFLFTLLLVAITAWLFIRFMVHRPVTRLMEGIRALSRGELGHRIKANREDELGELSRSFNSMTDRLEQAHRQNMSLNETLAQRVEEKTAELRRAQDNMIQVEKMASLGKLSASVAHEINNPLAGILTYSKLVQKKVDADLCGEDDRIKVSKYLSLIQSETTRCGGIVKNLLLFARKDNAEFSQEDICGIAEKSLLLAQHHLDIQNIKLTQSIPAGPLTVYGNANQLKQALLALLINAVESMDTGGELDVTLKPAGDGKRISLVISDSGNGIREEALPHIFEPFFTTKEDGKSVGLGLSVVYGIIQSHKGDIRVSSEVGKGTTFTLLLPVEKEPTAASGQITPY